MDKYIQCIFAPFNNLLFLKSRALPKNTKLDITIYESTQEAWHADMENIRNDMCKAIDTVYNREVLHGKEA